MQDLNFKSFRVHDGNRNAFEACEAVATLQHPDPQPILLVGGKEAGKTHLLWAIVNHIRASKMRVGLALIMAHEFPEKVRSLVRDPSPIQGGKRAILLVDGLELFKENGDDLEAVVRTFIDNGHNVVLATTSPPADLSELGKGFALLLESGESLDLLPSEQQEDNGNTLTTTSTGERDPDFAVRLLENERDRYKEELEKQSAEAHDLKAKFELAIAEQSRMNVLLADASRVDAMQEQHSNTIESLSEQLSAERSQTQTLREQLTDSTNTVESLNKKLDDAEGEEDAALAEQARLQGKLGSLSEVQQDFEQLNQEHDATTQEHDAATQERDAAIEERDAATRDNRQLIEQVEALLQKIGTEQAGLTRENEAMHTKLGQLLDSITENDCILRPADDFIELEQELAKTNDALQSLQKSIDTVRQEHNAKSAEWEADQNKLGSDLEESETERIRLKANLDEAQAMLGNVEFELEKSRRHDALLLAEMDALRNEAAAQVASANIQAGEMEHRIAGLESALDILRETGKAASRDVERKNKNLSEVAKELIALSSRLAILKDSAADSDDELDTDKDQGVLFPPTDFEALPRILPKTKTDRINVAPEISANDKSLRKSVEKALFAEGDTDENA